MVSSRAALAQPACKPKVPSVLAPRLLSVLLGAALLSACGNGTVLFGGSGGAAGSSGSGGSPCQIASITFELRPATGHAGDYCVGAADACNGTWLSITAPDGTALAIDQGCVTACDACQPIACPALCVAPSRLTADGVTQDWLGSAFMPSTCAGSTLCAERSCAPAGRYVAHMCAYADTGPRDGPSCSSAAAPTCTDVPFDWPPSGPGQATVLGTIGAPSNCCPSAWLLYSCSFMDGTPGLACHNPQMGCASSTTCGQGCDEMVSGSCADVSAR